MTPGDGGRSSGDADRDLVSKPLVAQRTPEVGGFSAMMRDLQGVQPAEGQVAKPEEAVAADHARVEALERECEVLRAKLRAIKGKGPPDPDPTVQNGPHSEVAAAPESLDPDWLKVLKERTGPWTAPPLVVLSLFDGLGATWQALHELGIPFQGYSSEIDPHAIRVVGRRWPAVKHVGDVKEIHRGRQDIPREFDLVIGGFPCQDLSIMNKNRIGLHGSRSSLFFHMLRLLQEFQPKWFIVENVASMGWVDRVEVTKYLGVRPLEVDSAELSPQIRRRYFWTTVPLPDQIPRLRDHPSTQLQAVVQNGVALENKCGCIMVANFGDKLCKGRLRHVMCSKTLKPRCITVTEIERVFGLPVNYTNVGFASSHPNGPQTPSPLSKKKASGDWAGTPSGATTIDAEQSKMAGSPRMGVGPEGREALGRSDTEPQSPPSSLRRTAGTVSEAHTPNSRVAPGMPQEPHVGGQCAGTSLAAGAGNGPAVAPGIPSPDRPVGGAGSLGASPPPPKRVKLAANVIPAAAEVIELSDSDDEDEERKEENQGPGGKAREAEMNHGSQEVVGAGPSLEGTSKPANESPAFCRQRSEGTRSSGDRGSEGIGRSRMQAKEEVGGGRDLEVEEVGTTDQLSPSPQRHLARSGADRGKSADRGAGSGEAREGQGGEHGSSVGTTELSFVLPCAPGEQESKNRFQGETSGPREEASEKLQKEGKKEEVPVDENEDESGKGGEERAKEGGQRKYEFRTRRSVSYAEEKIDRTYQKIVKHKRRNRPIGRPPKGAKGRAADWAFGAGEGEDNWKGRWALLGNSFSVQVMAYVMSPLLSPSVRATALRCQLPEVVPPQVTADKCAVMQKGELWALYNEAQRPNWYARIISREGGRFSSNCKGGALAPVKIVLHYLEFVKSYGELEPDWDPEKETGGWSSVRGTGAYRLSPSCDVEDNLQSSLLNFSHRVTSFLELGDERFFIYPEKDTVWTMRDVERRATWLVYVVDSSLDRAGIAKGMVGEEGFRAAVRLLIRLHRQVYRIDAREMVFTDLSKFSYETPFFYKNDRNTLVVEPHSHAEKQKRRSGDSDEEEEEEVDDGGASAEGEKATVENGGNKTGQ